MYIFVEMFEQKRQDLIAQQSQEVTTGIASIYNYIYTRTYKQLHKYIDALKMTTTMPSSQLCMYVM